MATQCTETFDKFATALGDFGCRGAEPVVHIRNPLGLSNWTLPVIELLMVAVAVAALVHAVRRLRRDGDPVNLALWCATVIYLFVIEIPLYFPNVFGIEDMLGVVFAHNVFTVEFLFDRLPLYIVALYPAVVTLAYEVVRSLGVFRDRGPLIGALCVGFVHHCFYEVFDQLGPQLRWWAWNTDNAVNSPMLASVPMTSMFIFATLGPSVVTVLVLFLVRGRQSGRVWRTVLAGVLTPLGLVVFSVPTTVFGGDNPNITAQAVLFSIEIAVIAVVGLVTLSRQWWDIRSGNTEAAEPNSFVRTFGALYLAVLAFLWAAALPDYVGAVDGVTADGTPAGSLLYATVSFLGAATCVAAVVTARRTAPATRP
ncbi:hypothetical protein [Mycobacterium sp. 236(2023)]|uniref:hypothetical protein n=1 Tax=Mycobacterium sp. 236(2023) TaxID=3038163 RepID=UPI002415369F|nr:hypothetical protein [Mycobacterium sp. 236(2023)]MDG4664915.1 hypothetical protein [Mycobacterium sp. 236(2023)]